MAQFAYLGALLFSIGGLTILDWRYQLAFWADKRATVLSMTCGMALFIAWDLLGIGLGIFLHGNSPYSLPFRILPEFPIEELFFLYLLCYVTLILYRGIGKLWRPTSS